MQCLKCEECLKTKCDIYRSRELKRAWEELLNEISKALKLDKFIEWLAKKLEGR